MRRRGAWPAWLVLLTALAGTGTLAAQAADEQELFAEGGVIEEADAGAPAGVSAEEAFLVSEAPQWGGRIDNTLEGSWTWASYPGSRQALRDEATHAVRASLAAELFLDARPSRDFRVFGKAKFDYASGDPGEDWRWEARIFELFTDFNWRQRVFFRTGKQVVQWGVGYFFSPADVLSLVSIDPEDPESEREGPLAFRAQAPLGAHNLYLYLVSDDIDRLGQIAVAPKLELVLGGYELGLGAFYQRELSPKAMLTLTGPLWKLDLFGEALVQWGSDRRAFLIEDRLLFSGTAGASYLSADGSFAVFAQYWYNGDNYDDPLLAKAAGVLYPSPHYLAASASLSDLFDAGLGASLYLLASLSDGSGTVVPTLTWEPFDYLQLHAAVTLGFGKSGSEYAPAGAGMALELGLSVGRGRF